MKGDSNKYSLPKGAVKVVIVIGITLIVLIAVNFFIFTLFGFQYQLTSKGLEYVKVIKYSEAESNALNILVNHTVIINEIPQIKYLEKKTGLGKDRIMECLRSLEKKGDIALDDSGKIMDAYPWTSRQTGILVYIGQGNQIAGPIFAASALYAISATDLFGPIGKIEARFPNNRNILAVEIDTGEIIYTNNIGALVYITDNYKDSRFFASSDGAREYYGDDFELHRLTRLDKALLIGDIIADRIKEKIEN